MNSEETARHSYSQDEMLEQMTAEADEFGEMIFDAEENKIAI